MGQEIWSQAVEFALSAKILYFHTISQMLGNYQWLVRSMIWWR